MGSTTSVQWDEDVIFSISHLFLRLNALLVFGF
jgi:hypothetical protein